MDSILLAKKVELFNQYLSELKELVGLGVNEILADTRNYHTAERLFQLLVDTAIDINTHLLKAQTGALPDDLQSTFRALSQANLLPPELADKMAPVVGLRNRIVHRYETLERRTFVELLEKNLSDFEKYAEVISAIIKKNAP